MTDGQVLPTLAPGQTVTVSKTGETVRIIPPAGKAFAATIVPGGSNVATSNGILQKIDWVRGRGGAEAACCRILIFFIPPALTNPARPPRAAGPARGARDPGALRPISSVRGRALPARARVQCLCPAFTRPKLAPV